MSKRVAIVEDDSNMAQSLLDIFRAESDFTVGEIHVSAEELMDDLNASDQSFDLALVDLGLPGLSGQDLIAWLRRKHPQTQCVAHTVFEDQNNVLSALRAGAAGYLLKGLKKQQLLQSLRTLDQGGAPLTPKIASLLVSEFQGISDNPLSTREKEVLALLSQGFAYKECAHHLTVSIHTVHDHIKRIYSKLKVNNKRQAVNKATRKGWL